MINKDKALSDIDKQIADLQKQKIEVLESSKNEVKEKIDGLLEKSGYKLEELYPKLAKKSVSFLEVKQKVEINNKSYKLPAEGIGKRVKDALKAIGKNPNDYDRAKLLQDFK